MASLSTWWTATEAWQFVALSRHTFRKRFTCWMLRIRTRLKKLAPNSSDYSYPVIGLWCAYEFDSALFLITRQRTGVQFIIFLLKLYRHQIDIFAAFYDFFCQFECKSLPEANENIPYGAKTVQNCCSCVAYCYLLCWVKVKELLLGSVAKGTRES